jgi:hypothetical protein
MEWFSLVEIKDTSSGKNEENTQKSSYDLSEVIKLYKTENADGRVEDTSKVAILIYENGAYHTVHISKTIKLAFMI